MTGPTVRHPSDAGRCAKELSCGVKASVKVVVSRAVVEDELEVFERLRRSLGMWSEMKFQRSENTAKQRDKAALVGASTSRDEAMDAPPHLPPPAPTPLTQLSLELPLLEMTVKQDDQKAVLRLEATHVTAGARIRPLHASITSSVHSLTIHDLLTSHERSQLLPRNVHCTFMCLRMIHLVHSSIIISRHHQSIDPC